METSHTCPGCRKPLPPDVPLGLCPECLIKAGFNTGSESGGEPGGFIPPPIEHIAKLFPQLEIIELVGQGGMGAVYKARQPALDRFVALKILLPRVEEAGGFAERFNREARALAKLVHPNIVAVHDFGQAGDLHYLIMEFVDGANLREVERSGGLAPEQALAIVPQICAALQFAHNEGIVHRDIKPENILLDKKGHVKITDFGIAKMLGQTWDNTALTGAKDVVGTPHYMAPEQIERPTLVDHRADIYSLGVVFYEMLTGELPLGKFAAPSKKVQVDVRLDEVVLHTLEKEPERRYQRAEQLKADVETIARPAPGAPGPAAQGAPAALPPTPSGRASSDKVILPAFLLAFLFGVFGAHRFYVGRNWTGLLQLGALGGCVGLIIACATLGGEWEPALGILLGVWICACGTWATIDWILILCKAFTDGQGKKLTHWLGPDGGQAQPNAAMAGGGGPAGAAGSPLAKDSGLIIAPAVGLMATAVLKLFSALTALLFLGGLNIGWRGTLLNDLGLGFFPHWKLSSACILVLFKLIPAVLILIGAVQMVQIRSYAWAVAAAVLALLSCSLVGFPIGIWALVILMRPRVREAFAEAPHTPSSAKAKWWWGMAGVAVVLIVLALTLVGPGPTLGWGDLDTPMPRLQTIADDTPVERTVPTNATGNDTAVGDAAHFHKSFLVAPRGTLTVDVDRGSIRVTGSEQNSVEVQVDRQVTRADASEAARILREECLILKQTGNDVSISAQDPPSLHGDSSSTWWGWWRQPDLQVHYEITVPRKSSLRLETSGGAVQVANLNGSVNVKTLGGGLEFTDLEGSVNGHTQGGGIRAIACKSDLLIQTLGGGITIEQFTGPCVHATTQGGSIRAGFTAAPKGNCELRTLGGSVTVRLPATVPIVLDAHTTGGTVTTELPVQTEGQLHNDTVKGTINGGGPLLKLETMGGSIQVLKQ